MIIESMKANELRIGNYIRTYGQDVGHRTIVGINPEGVNLLEQDEKIDYNLIDPIPLTEEWLEKFGFEKYNHKWWRYDKNGMFDISEEWNAFGFKTCVWTNDNIRYVHQLQNLYFALTGEELEIK